MRRRSLPQAILWLQVALGTTAFWAWALGLHGLALSVIRYRGERAAALTAANDTIVFAEDDGIHCRGPRGPSRSQRTHPGLSLLAALPTIFPRHGKVPSLWNDPQLPAVDRAAPLRDLEVDAGIRKRLEPDRFPSLQSPESERWRW